MRLRSLRLRLFAVSAAAILVALAIAGMAISGLFLAHVERNFEDQLRAELDRLVALVDPSLATPLPRQPLPDPRYELPAGGAYWQLSDPSTGAVGRSRSLWDAVMPGPADPTVGATPTLVRMTDPAGTGALALAQRLSFQRVDLPDRVLDVMVAASTAGVDAANLAFRQDLVRALAVLAAALFASTWVQVALGLAPLQKIKHGIAAIRRGSAHALAGDYPTEITPLVAEVNDLIALQERSITFARERAAELAHGLKTALTQLNGETFALRQSGATERAVRIQAITDSMTATVDHQLRLARLRHRSRSDGQSTEVAPVIARIVSALRRTPQGAGLEWVEAITPKARVALDAMDFTELAGILLENAADWADHRVLLSAEVGDGCVRLIVEDDGPGVDEAELAKLGQRGNRCNASPGGNGLGLAIAREIIALNSGRLEFSRAAMGGLRVEVELASSV